MTPEQTARASPGERDAGAGTPAARPVPVTVSARLRTLAVLERNLTVYRRVWRASAFSMFMLPVLFLAGFGLGVGRYVPALDGVPYLDWIVPGVLASAAFQIAVSESTYPVFGDFNRVRSYHAMRATPVEPGDMVRGWLAYLLIRAGLAVPAFLAVAALFGALRSPWAAITPLVCALLTVAVAAPVTALAATIGHEQYFALVFRFGMLPMTLFSGVFFPVDRLPAAAVPLAYLSPLWHAVELCRAATLGGSPPWPAAVHVAYLAALAAAGTYLAVRAFGRRLCD
ncbi:ABC transporter permease [Spongiactinospora sp. TRM90649]|uniref:ABC transporter permease n=1 Tax=Spongiactinospora sp. TRM90649 TaxID=3031114 RepID=UPI0023F956ED|nr:ABC transporter permease [Spongiactinospora sp. TRM90649]MDF5756694.1 ABC transporter permease [Spongiactinospora sp. TRM90649]